MVCASRALVTIELAALLPTAVSARSISEEVAEKPVEVLPTYESGCMPFGAAAHGALQHVHEAANSTFIRAVSDQQSLSRREARPFRRHVER